jgi:PPOX class probable F420-dependent enzyme
VSSGPYTTDSSGHETTDDRRFVTLESASYLLLTTFKQDGTPLAVPVRVVVDGDRAYFGMWAASGPAKHLRRTDWVQVVRCSPLGMASFGPRVNAMARLLTGAEAGHTAERLAHTRPAWREAVRSLADRVTRRQRAYYELRPDEAAKEPAPPPPTVTARVVRTRTARSRRPLPPVPLR